MFVQRSLVFKQKYVIRFIETIILFMTHILQYNTHMLQLGHKYNVDKPIFSLLSCRLPMNRQQGVIIGNK